ncbi:MAG: hypothetical protein WA997_13830, partial [Anaerolineales bacterium]
RLSSHWISIGIHQWAHLQRLFWLPDVGGVVHILFLVGFRSKMVIMMAWAWNYLANERGARTITGDPQLKVKEVRGINMADWED